MFAIRLPDLKHIVSDHRRKFVLFILEQAFRIRLTCLGVLGIVGIQQVAPELTYQYHYLYLSDTFVFDVLRFWPAILFIIILNVGAIARHIPLPKVFDEEFLRRDVITSVGAGVSEEAWFRGVAPYYYALGALCANYFLESWPPFIVGALCGPLMYFSIAGMVQKDGATLVLSDPLGRITTFLACVFALTAVIVYDKDPLLSLTNDLFYPVIRVLSFGTMSSVLPGVHDSLVVLGMVFANFAFRDGHKYQWIVGWINSWWMGCVFIFATLTYGLWVAMTVHAIVDIVVAISVYIGQKLKPEPVVVDEVCLPRPRRLRFM